MGLLVAAGFVLMGGFLLCGCFVSFDSPAKALGQEPGVTVKPLWGDVAPPGAAHTRCESPGVVLSAKLVGGRAVAMVSDVAIPELHLYRRDKNSQGDTAVVVCPGGGFSILAWDLEGTEVAKWLNSLGVTVGVLKYRVPTKHLETQWQAPVQDAQRAISIIRGMSSELGVDIDKVGVMGFSAGAIAAARTGLMRDRQYAARDRVDQNSCFPNFMALVYAGGLIDSSGQHLKPDLVTDGGTPPVFIVHAFDDHVPIDTPLVLLRAMKRAGVRSEFHLYDAGGHGFGVRRVAGTPVTMWADRFEQWMDRNGWLKSPQTPEPLGFDSAGAAAAGELEVPLESSPQ
jgi:acetyl esterase/lipase